MLTGELVVVALEARQRDARCERRQRACVTRANRVSFEKKNTTVCMTGTTILSVENARQPIHAPVNWLFSHAKIVSCLHSANDGSAPA